MQSLRATSSQVTVRHQVLGGRPALLPVRRAVSSKAQSEKAQSSDLGLTQYVALSTAVTTLMTSGNAMAATELATLAESTSDGRAALLGTLLLPAVGWVLFNIGGALLNQLDTMGDKAAEVTPDRRSLRLKRGVAGAMGLGAAGLLASAPADAATELSQLAASDNRVSILLTLALPALGWVAFNIAGGLANQLDTMGDKAKEITPDRRSLRLKRGVAGALGLGAASLLASAPAEAVTELSQLAASDNRVGILATLFVPALGWVAFNIAGGLANQLNTMGDYAKDAPPSKRSVRVKRGVAGAIGLGAASLLASAPAEAATELSQLAASDNRVGILLTLALPALGWVAFNIAGGLANQLDTMGDKAKEITPDRRSLRLKRGVAGALGLGAAGLLASAPAEAVTELSQLAASDNRVGILATLFVPALGWVAFNIAGGLSNQLSAMGDYAKDAPPSKRSVRVKRGIAGAIGLGAASLLASAPAEAATELSQLAAGDNRVGILATLFVPVLGWVLFNIAGGLANQLNTMGDQARETTPDKRSIRRKK